MKTITYEAVTDGLARLIRECLRSVESASRAAIAAARDTETGELARWALNAIAENADIAEREHCFACQDCGMAVVFATVGSEANLGFDLGAAIDEGVRRGYGDARKSVADPLTRVNTLDNTPPVVYYEFMPGSGLKLEFLAKGAGSENASSVYMLTPSKGRAGIVECAVDCVRRAGANPCPPVILGIGVGGTLDKAAVLSKKALLRPTGTPSEVTEVAALEGEILERVNALGIGAQGLGGSTTALAVHIETFPTHIGMLPVAITVQCHSVRHGKIEF